MDNAERGGIRMIPSPPPEGAEAPTTSTDSTGVGLNPTNYGCGTSSPFNVQASLDLQFGEYRYILRINGQEQIRRLYTEPVLPDEAEDLANKALAHAFAEIKRLSGSKE